MKRITIVIFIFIVFFVSIFLYFFFNKEKSVPEVLVKNNLNTKETVIGTSVEGRAIKSYIFGDGNIHIIFVGGIHGGYEWNSVLLAYQFIDYLNINPEVIPQNITVSVIPSANPDGVYKVIGKEGRFSLTDVLSNVSEVPGRVNAHNVDLNRNFDCKWQATSTWKGNIVSAGTMAFSEPETKAIRDFIIKDKPSAVIFWHSQSSAVYASECKAGILTETLEIMNAYSRTSGYPAIRSFSGYQITGDAEGWLASINIPAITVELTTHETTEWDRNLAGIKAIFEYYKNK